MKYTTSVFKNSAGLYWNDRWKAIIEACSKLVLSLILIKPFGITGVFLGTVISMVVTSVWVEPYIVYKHVLKEKFKEFIKNYCVYLSICGFQVGIISLVTVRLSGDHVLDLLLQLFLCLFVTNLSILIIFNKTERFQQALLYLKPINNKLMQMKNHLIISMNTRLFHKIKVGENKLEEDNNMMEETGMEVKYIGIVVVTYNRLNQLKVILEHIKYQSYQYYQVFIIDNASTDGTREYLKAFVRANNQFHYYRLKRNLGSAGGYHHGMKLAYNAGVDYIWGLEDDSLPEMNALYSLVSSLSEVDRKTCLTSYTMHTFGRQFIYSEYKYERLIPKKQFGFASFFVPRSLIEDIGYPRKDLFMCFDDIDYSYKAHQAGYSIYMVRDSIVQHPDKDKNKKKSKLFGSAISLMPKWKWYYYMRNGILVQTEDTVDKDQFNKNHRKNLMGVLLTKPSCFPAALSGYIDGKRGTTGKSKRYP
jgi:GT2 family glycosyltransferase